MAVDIRSAGAVLDGTATPQSRLLWGGDGTRGTSTPFLALPSDNPFVDQEFRAERDSSRGEIDTQVALAILVGLIFVIAWLSSHRDLALDVPPRPGSILQSALDRLWQLTKLRADWDSYGGQPPTKQSINTASGLLFEVDEKYSAAVGSRISPFAIVPLAYGGVQIEWRGPSAEIEVEIGPDGEFGYLFIDKRAPDRVFHEKDDAQRSEILDLIAQTLIPSRA